MQKPTFPTIFGFDTFHKITAKAIDMVYWVIISVAYIFAFHSLNLILVSWNWALVALASLGVVGLPYCVKIILFNREKFPTKAALLCMFLSLLPTIFDFAGFFAETGLQDSLRDSKIKISEQLNYFEAQSKKAAQVTEDTIKENERNAIVEIEQSHSKKLEDINKQINEANQKVIDEKTGVKADYSSGKEGSGPRTKELQAAVRRLQSEADIELNSSREKIGRGAELVKQQKKEEIKKLTDANKIIDNKFTELKKTINNTKNFKELEIAVVDSNALLSTIAAKVNVEFVPVSILGSDNILKLAFGSLFRFDVTALVCLLMAFLMEIGDIVIVYVIRYEKVVKREIHIAKVDTPRKDMIFKKTYSGY